MCKLLECFNFVTVIVVFIFQLQFFPGTPRTLPAPSPSCSCAGERPIGHDISCAPHVPTFTSPNTTAAAATGHHTGHHTSLLHHLTRRPRPSSCLLRHPAQHHAPPTRFAVLLPCLCSCLHARLVTGAGSRQQLTRYFHTHFGFTQEARLHTHMKHKGEGI